MNYLQIVESDKFGEGMVVKEQEIDVEGLKSQISKLRNENQELNSKVKSLENEVLEWISRNGKWAVEWINLQLDYLDSKEKIQHLEKINEALEEENKSLIWKNSKLEAEVTSLKVRNDAIIQRLNSLEKNK